MTSSRSMARVFTNRPVRWAALGLLVWALGTLPTLSQSQEPASDIKAEAPVDAKLLLIGSLASSHVYTTHGYIGVVADNAQKELYTPARVDELMQEVTVLADSLAAQLKALKKSDLTPEDAKVVQEIIDIYALLKQESDALRVYAKDKTEAHGNEFHRVRAAAWTRVAKLLEIPVKAQVP
jgi:hypothetical protein